MFQVLFKYLKIILIIDVEFNIIENDLFLNIHQMDHTGDENNHRSICIYLWTEY